MKFIQLTNTSYEAELVFQHAYYSQENRPVFESFEESREKKRGSKAGWTQGPLEEISSVPKKIKYSDPQVISRYRYIYWMKWILAISRECLSANRFKAVSKFTNVLRDVSIEKVITAFQAFVLALYRTLQEAFQILNVEEDLRRYSFTD